MVLGFKDIYPQAKIHLLFIPKKHTCDIAEMDDYESLSEVFKAITSYAKKEGLDQNGYRIVNNKGVNGGQSVFHTHFHLLAGEPLRGFGS